MQKFIKNILLFLSPVILIGLIFIYFFNFSNKIEFKDNNNKQGIQNIILGDSHIGLGVYDKYIEKTKSYGNIAENYIFSYYKLLHLYKSSPQIKNVFLGASYHNFAKYYDESTFNPDFVGRYFEILPFEQQIYFLENSNNLISSIKYIIYYGTENYFSDSTSYIGGFNYKYVKEKTSNAIIEKRINKQYGKLDSNNLVSKINIEYFYKIIDFCKKKKLNLTLIQTPLHTEYRKHIPKIMIDTYYKHTAGMKILEFDTAFVENNDYFMPDGDHLKYKGAVKFSKLLNKYIHH